MISAFICSVEIALAGEKIDSCIDPPDKLPASTELITACGNLVSESKQRVQISLPPPVEMDRLKETEVFKRDI